MKLNLTNGTLRGERHSVAGWGTGGSVELLLLRVQSP